MKNKNPNNREILYEGNFFRLVREGPWEYVERTNCSAIVVIIPVTAKREVVLIEQHRVPAGADVIEFPAGLVNDQKNKKEETLKTAARRELLEETGYHAKSLRFLFSGPTAPGLCPEILTIYLATGLEKKGQGGGVELESIIVHKVPLKRVLSWLGRMQKRGKRVDPKVYFAIHFLNNYFFHPPVFFRHTTRRIRRVFWRTRGRFGGGKTK